MKLQFKVQQYQIGVADAVVEIFAGQPKHNDISYRIDPGKVGSVTVPALFEAVERLDADLRNAEIVLSSVQLLENMHAMQRSRSLPLSAKLAPSTAAPGAPSLDTEMETGTGKTHVYIKTIMEPHKRYGRPKHIVVVSPIAICEGAKKSFGVTVEHFQRLHGTKSRSFMYNSSQLYELEWFSSDAGMQVMIINIQAFSATGKNNRRIYDELNDFRSRRPIDVVSASRPIVIISEPQEIGAPKPLEALSQFNVLMLLRYSATHKADHTKVHQLDALDAYNQKLVKEIVVRGITVKGLTGSTAYLYLDTIEIAKGVRPRTRIEVEVQTVMGIRRQVKRLNVSANLHDVSNGIKAYRGLFVTEIDANRDAIELNGGGMVTAGQLADRGVTEETERRIQICEVVHAHLDEERELFDQGVKVLSLFFTDGVIKYHDYSRQDTLDDCAQMFEEEYVVIRDEVFGGLAIGAAIEEYQAYLRHDGMRQVYGGYFPVGKKTKHQIDGEASRRGDSKGQFTGMDVYDLTLKDKERPLSFAEPVRPIFSHSALREGQDNPNTFVVGMLKKGDNTVSRRQEIGRDLRLPVDQHGEWMGNSVAVHDINESTVMTDESYTGFVTGLQRGVSESLVAQLRKVSVAFFVGKTIQTPSGESVIGETVAQAPCKYLIKNSYANDDGAITDVYKQVKKEGTLAAPTSEVFRSIIDFVWPLIDVLYLDPLVPTDDRKSKKIPLDEANFAHKEFQELWGRINHRAVYQVGFGSAELIRKVIAHLDRHLNVAVLQYVVRVSRQRKQPKTDDLISSGSGFAVQTAQTHTETVNARPQVKYSLLEEITEKTQLTRRTVAAILSGVMPGTFVRLRLDLEQFVTEAARLINEQKATVIVEHLTYDALEDRFDSTILTGDQIVQGSSKAGAKLKERICDYVAIGSRVKHQFVAELDISYKVAAYAKLPRGFFVPTPASNYSPDWATAFTEGSVKHLYFVADIKGSLPTLQFKGVENAKIECARKFFTSLGKRNGDGVTYDVVADYTELMQSVTS